MRLHLLILFLILIFSNNANVVSQNLVPNNSFEEYEFLGYNTNCNETIYKATQWYNPTWWSTFWYLNKIHNNCIEPPNGTFAGVPQNMWGYRWPVSGDGYVIVGSSVARNSEDNNRNKRFASIQVELTQNLTIGHIYCVSFWISYPENVPVPCPAFNYTKEIGALFSTYKRVFIGVSWDSLPGPGLPAQIVNTKENWLDTTHWYLVSGSFVADSNYQYMTISHFLPDSLLTTLIFCPNDYTQGVFVDMVSVYDCTGHNYTCNAGGNQKICAGESVVLGTDSDNRRQYRWSPAVGLSDSTAARSIASPTETTTYYLYVIDEFLQQSYDTITVEVVYCDVFIPNIFSPNGDGQNDVLYVRGQGIEQLTFTVYNRWGEVVFQTTDPGKGWDGTYKGRRTEPGVYVYHVSAVLQDGLVVSRHGDVTLVR